MTIKVIGAGFGRTGTLSLKHALERLGFGKAHHMMEVGKSLKQINSWADIANKDAGDSSIDWDSVFAGFQSTTDFPACVYYAELAEHYPRAKILLTVRDEDSWYKSVEQTILPVSKVVPRWVLAIAPPLRRMHGAVTKIVWQRTFGGRAHDAEYAKSVFRTHNQTVVESFPADRVLVFQAKDGWQPLCEFLGVDVPPEPFPHVNDTAEMKRRIKILKALNWLPLAALAVLLLALIAR